MWCIDNPYTNPCFNLAAEEYFFKYKKENVFILWQNRPVVVIGKHQNVYREVNREIAQANHIRIIRRITGGGAVYQDMGNFNFTFIGDYRMIKTDELTCAIRDFLRSIGVPAEADKRKNILIDGLKVSGSAQGIYKERSLHHGTLLFASDLSLLTSVLKGNTEYDGMDGFSVSSVKSPVANISTYLSPSFTINQFRKQFFSYCSSLFPSSSSYIFTPEDLAAITYLKENKYATYIWNYRVASVRYPLVSQV